MAYIPSDQRRAAIIQAAVEVIAREGLERTTTRRIAETAGAPLGAIHYCFRNKEEILAAIADEGAARIQAAFEPIDPTEGLRATIINDIDALWAWYQENLGLQLALTEMGLARIRRGGPPKEVYAIWDRFGRRIMMEHLKVASRHDTEELQQPANVIVRFILHRFDGLTLEYAASRDRKACQEQVDLLKEAILFLAFRKT
ncbi:MAG TPA: helix-turn-helix domain-containing protein [Rhodothermales bacterium]